MLNEDPNVKYYSSPDELVQRLQLLTASKKAGTQSKAIDNEIVKILTQLYNDDIINQQGRIQPNLNKV